MLLNHGAFMRLLLDWLYLSIVSHFLEREMCLNVWVFKILLEAVQQLAQLGSSHFGAEHLS
jgi:hypothetical protein